MLKQKVKQNFSRSAYDYHKYAILQKNVAETVCQIAKRYVSKSSIILDAGCGTGFVGSNLAINTQAAIYQCDIAANMCKVAAQNNKAAYTIQGDMESLPLPNASIEAVISSLALQWSKPEQCFNEWKRVLTAEGKLILATFGTTTLQELRYCMPHRVLHYPTSQELIAGLERAGFEVEYSNIVHQVEQYSSIYELLRYMKHIGANQYAETIAAPATKSEFKWLEKHYQKEFGNKATWEVVTLVGRRL